MDGGRSGLTSDAHGHLRMAETVCWSPFWTCVLAQLVTSPTEEHQRHKTHGHTLEAVPPEIPFDFLYRLAREHGPTPYFS